MKATTSPVSSGGTDVVADADQVTSDSLPKIGFTGLDDFAVQGQTGNDAVTFVTQYLVGATAANYSFADVGPLTDVLIIEGHDGSAADNYTVTNPAGNVVVTDNTGNNVVVTGTGLGRLQLNTLGGDDTVTVNAGGTDVIAAPITYDGGSGSDVLRVTGNPATTVNTVTYSPGADVTEGRLTYDADANATNGVLMTIDFANLEPVQDNVVAGNLVVNGTNADNAIDYSMGPGGGIFGATQSGLVSVDGFETIEFNNKGLLTLNGLAGSDKISLNYQNAAAFPAPFGLGAACQPTRPPSSSTVATPPAAATPWLPMRLRARSMG